MQNVLSGRRSDNNQGNREGTENKRNGLDQHMPKIDDTVERRVGIILGIS